MAVFAGPTPSLREQQRQFTRQRLFDAACRLFFEQGYSAATIDEITAAAGASRATFYLHFRSKLEIARELHETIAFELDLLWSRLGALPTATWVERVFDCYAARQLELTVVAEASAVEPELAAERRAALEAAGRVIAPHVGGAVRAAMLLAQLERFTELWPRQLGLDRDEVLEAFTDAWSN
jgi:AcrR family transcriptional regulator